MRRATGSGRRTGTSPEYLHGPVHCQRPGQPRPAGDGNCRLLEAYGLEEGTWTLETVDSEGNTAQLRIGNSFTDTDDETCYYATVPDSDSILILDASLVDQLTDTVHDLADTSPMDTVDESQVTDATIQGAQTTSFTVQAQTVENDDGQEETEYHWY